MRAWGMALVFLAVGIVGCGSNKDTSTSTKGGSKGPAPKAPADPWILTTLDAEGGAPAYLSNGLIGIRIAKTGGGLDNEGKPLGFFMIDEYEQTGEEKIIRMPNPALVAISVGNKLYNGQKDHDFMKSGGTPLDPRKGKDFSQKLDMKTGVLTTQWTQDTSEAGEVKISSETVIHPDERVFAQSWKIETKKDSPFAIRTLDYAGPEDAQQPLGGDEKSGITISASKRRLVAMTWKVAGADPGALGQVDGVRVQEGTAKAGTPVSFERVLSFGARSKTPLPEFTVKNVNMLQKLAPKPYAFAEVRKASVDGWAKRWKTDIEIDGPVEDQQAVRSFMFYLQSSIHPKGGMSISPFALSDTQYNGHVFWDADMWVFPALSLINPEAATAVPQYRLDRDRVAYANFRTWIDNENRPVGNGNSMGHYVPKRLLFGSKYPWESSVTGKETVIGPSKFEDHITGDVLWSRYQAASLGLLKPPTSPYKLTFYDYRSEKTARGLEIKNTMSPDENHTGDNDLYTNLLAEWLLNDHKWAEKPTYYLPKDDKCFLTYDGDLFKGYKQAAAVLSIYPLQYPPAEKQAKVMMERFADKVIKNGPAMTDSIHALIWARLGETEKAYETWHASWQPFTNNGLLLFSEKRNKDLAYFTTGAGGSLQSLLYGFLGLRLDYKKEPGAAWSKQLLQGTVLSVKPNLPKAWKSVKFKNFTVLGTRLTLTANHSAQGGTVASVTQGE